jgi:hypothetical protein
MKNLTGQAIFMHGTYKQVLFPLRLDFKARGRAKIQVLNPDKSVVREFEQNNLILNQGIDGIAVRNWCDSFLYCCAGSGTTPTADSSGGTTAAQSGTTVTLTGGSFTFTSTLADAGKIIRWASSSQARIVTVTDGQHAVVDVSQTVGAGAFTVYRTNQTGLTAEIVRTNNYVTGGGNCGTTLTGGNIFNHLRTWDFPVEVGSVTYSEIGFSWSGTVGANLFARIVLGSPVSLLAGQTLRIIYTLNVTVGPITPNFKAASVIGWPVLPATDTNGQEQIQYYGLSAVDTTGLTIAYDAGNFVNEPSATAGVQIFLSTVGTAPATVGSAINRTGVSPADKNVTLTTYVANSGTLDKYCVFLTTEANATTWLTIGLGRSDMSFLPYVNSTFVFVFGSAQTKDNLHTLEIHFSMTFGVDLS